MMLQYLPYQHGLGEIDGRLRGGWGSIFGWAGSVRGLGGINQHQVMRDLARLGQRPGELAPRIDTWCSRFNQDL